MAERESEARAEPVDGNLNELITRIHRNPRQGIFERTLCIYIIQSNNSKPLRSITSVVNGALLLSIEERRRVGINEAELDVLRNVAFTLMTPTKGEGEVWIDRAGTHRNPSFQLMWGFSQTVENYLVYVEPWCKGVSDVLWDQDEELQEEIDDMRVDHAFWYKTNYTLPESSYQALVNQFITWALPRSQEIKAQLAMIVTPSTFNEMMRSYRPRQAEDAE